jgi:hypothetical protein
MGERLERVDSGAAAEVGAVLGSQLRIMVAPRPGSASRSYPLAMLLPRAQLDVHSDEGDTGEVQAA